VHVFITGMSSPCYNTMDPKQFEEFPSSTNTVEYYKWFSKSSHREALKQAMMVTCKEDMAQGGRTDSRIKLI